MRILSITGDMWGINIPVLWPDNTGWVLSDRTVPAALTQGPGTIQTMWISVLA